tara:strand:- start:242 stop:580 length:339 start_codon:yes stop_codon:yes gene_type:complete
MNILNQIVTVFKKSFVLKGRASRSEFWWFVLFVFTPVGFILNSGYDTVAMITLLLVAPASITVTVRRFHDQDKSGWWYFLGLIPILGVLMIYIICAFEGTKGKNQYGEAPKN